LGLGVEIRRTRGAPSGFVDFAGEEGISSLMLLGRSKRRGMAGVENIPAVIEFRELHATTNQAFLA
jgi:hypothetical protein